MYSERVKLFYDRDEHTSKKERLIHKLVSYGESVSSLMALDVNVECEKRRSGPGSGLF